MKKPNANVIIITGLSGAGKTTALNVFEDLRYFPVDGLPASLAVKMANLFDGQDNDSLKGLALGLDTRQQDFVNDWNAALEELENSGVAPQIVFVEANTEVLLRRYATTRRPHPLDQGGLGLESAIEKERELLEPIKRKAALVIDSSTYSVHDLRRAIQDKWGAIEDAGNKGLRVHLISFGFKYGAPSEADFCFDLRFLPNPYFDEKLRTLSGKNPDVANYVLAKDPGKSFIIRLEEFIQYILPLFYQEGRYRVTIALGCTGGRHRSVATTEAIFKTLKNSNYAVSMEHRHLELG